MLYLGPSISHTHQVQNDPILNAMQLPEQIFFLQSLISAFEHAVPDDCKKTSLQSVVRAFNRAGTKRHALGGGFVATKREVHNQQCIQVWSHAPYGVTCDLRDDALFFGGNDDLENILDRIFPHETFLSTKMEGVQDMLAVAYLRKR